MSSRHRNRSNLFSMLVIVSLLCSSTIVNGQLSEPALPQKVPSPYRQSPIRTYRFKHAKASEAFKIFKTLAGVSDEDMERAGGLAVDERTNSIHLMHTGPESEQDAQELEEMEEIFKTLDEPAHTSTSDAKTSAAAKALTQPAQAFNFSIDFERGESLESLKQRYNELEQQTHQLADKLKQSKSPNKLERRELQAAVRKSFEARQALQRAELADLAQRLKNMQQSIDMREKLADKVIERRVEDLLNPNLKWDLLVAKEQKFEGPNIVSQSPPSTPISAPYDPGKPAKIDLSTPQATLNYIHRYSMDHPTDVLTECYTEEALQELSGVMLQQLCFMSALSQVSLHTAGVIGAKDGVPIVSDTTPSFQLRVDTLLEEHSLPTPPDECKKAFELLVKLTIRAMSDEESRVKPDRELLRLAAGILKSPKDFLSKAGELSKRFNDSPTDTNSSEKELEAPSKYELTINGDEATATVYLGGATSSIPMSFKLKRINQRWLVSEVFSDEILAQIVSSMSQVFVSQ